MPWTDRRRDMQDPLTRAQYYQDQAINMRTLAQNEDNLELRNALISIAEKYERLGIKFHGLHHSAAEENVQRFNL